MVEFAVVEVQIVGDEKANSVSFVGSKEDLEGRTYDVG